MTAPAGEGIPGFSGRDLPLAAGAVTGVRLWRVDRAAAEAVDERRCLCRGRAC